MIRTLIGFVITAVVVTGGGVPQRGQAGYGRARSELVLEISSDEAGWARTVKLFCDPPGGGHPDPAGACAAIEKSGADPAKLRAVPKMCMLIFAPVTARITGTWRGTAVTWSHSYGNSCEMNRATGVLFQF